MKSIGRVRLGSTLFREGSHRLPLESFRGAQGTGGKTHFGFQEVSEDEKAQKVHGVFKNVASQYDLMNDAMSLGIHRLWKDYFMFRIRPTTSTQLLDVAGGTGDIAFRFLKHATGEKWRDVSGKGQESGGHQDRKEPHVTVCDINQSMLDVGAHKSEQMGISRGVSWVCGDAEELPFNDNTFDLYTIAFGIRNCTHIDAVVEEAHRVLKPGGRFACLEFSRVNNPVLKKAYDWYSFQVIPVLGQLIAGDWHSYQYLVESIRQFPDQESFADLIEDVGFRYVTYENLTNGVVSIHSGFKLNS